MHLKNILLVCTICMCFISKAQQPATVSGTVVDEKKLPLPGATVFLTGTTRMTACDNNGRFSLSSVPAGSYELVIKMIGYLPYIKPITLTAGTLTANARMTPNTSMLKAITIYPDYEWEKYLRLFKKQFLGQSYNAGKCRIINSEVINFSYNKKEKTLTANADEFLIIENKALGYRLKYLLAGFNFNENTNIVAYQGYPYYENLTGNKQQQTLWSNNRKTAYLGSINHFFRCVYADSVYEEGFYVYKLAGRRMGGVVHDNDKEPVLYRDRISFDSLVTVKNQSIKELSYKDCLYVVYIHEKEPDDFTSHSFNIKQFDAEIPQGQASLVYLTTDKVTIDRQGSFSPPNGLFFEGYWAWEKIADMLPLEYTISSKGS